LLIKGVEYVTDDKGRKNAVLIDLETHRDLREAFCEILKVQQREN
jgi:hypothetical protein